VSFTVVNHGKPSKSLLQGAIFAIAVVAALVTAAASTPKIPVRTSIMKAKKYLQVGLPDTVRGLNLFRPVIPPKSRGVAQCMDLNKLFLKLSIF